MIYLLINNIVTIIAVIISYNLGLRNKQKIDNKEEVKVIPNPIESYQNYKQEKVEKKELDKLNTIMNNIDAYDGTSKGQVEVSK